MLSPWYFGVLTIIFFRCKLKFVGAKEQSDGKMDRKIAMLSDQKKDRKIKFSVNLCNDVLVDILRSGKRRQLAMLEPIGRRFPYIVNRCFAVEPFLVFDLSTVFEQPSHCCKTVLSSLESKVSPMDHFVSLTCFFGS